MRSEKRLQSYAFSTSCANFPNFFSNIFSLIKPD